LLVSLEWSALFEPLPNVLLSSGDIVGAGFKTFRQRLPFFASVFFIPHFIANLGISWMQWIFLTCADPSHPSLWVLVFVNCWSTLMAMAASSIGCATNSVYYHDLRQRVEGVDLLSKIAQLSEQVN
jgi:hypothetical protein